MKLNVPLFAQTSLLNCGPTALRMVLAYFDKDYGLDLLSKLVRIQDGKGVSTIKIAIAASELGYKVKFYSISLTFNQSNMELDYYKKYGDLTRVHESEKLCEEAKKKRIELQERSISLEELLSFITEDSIPIVLLNWSVVVGKKEKGYVGHFVPVVGYDDNNIFVHNQDTNNPQAFVAIPKNIFEEARKAKGTDEDIAIIYRK